MDYREFINGKHVRNTPVGIDVRTEQLNGKLFDWQKHVVQWALKQGRAALFADCGLGKSFMQLEWANQLHLYGHAKRILLLCPIAVAEQTLAEAGKFGIESPIQITESQEDVDDGINVTNYEKLHKYDCRSFDAVVLDESSILKSFTGATKRALVDSFSGTRFKLACTATPAPNDLIELGNHSEFLGVMPREEMKARWFINDSGNTSIFRLKGHAKRDFWQWVSSWAKAASKPSDVGDYDDSLYVLPKLNLHEIVVEAETPAGFLFHPGTSVSATTIHQEKRASLDPKADRIAELVSDGELWVCWVDTDYEADALTKRIPDAVEVRGSHKESLKRERLKAFTNGEIRVMVTKPEIGGFGLNWQHCHNMTYMAGFSFERWYQAVRRLWRFWQQHEVNVYLMMSEIEESIKRTFDRKMQQHADIGAELCREIKEASVSGPSRYEAEKAMEVPSWLTAAV